MSEYTPTTDEVREAWRRANGAQGPYLHPSERRAEFDRWLAGEKAAALREAADAAVADSNDVGSDWWDSAGRRYVRPSMWLRDRADLIEKREIDG